MPGSCSFKSTGSLQPSLQLRSGQVSAELPQFFDVWLPPQLVEAGAWLQAVFQQVVGVADTRVEAPNGVPIQPLVEPLSEEIKYLLFDFTLAEVDINLLEEDQLLRLQVWALQ